MQTQIVYPQRRSAAAAGALALAAFLLAACQPPLPKVEGWRRLGAGEARKLSDARRAESPMQPPPIIEVEGDFNGDGKTDRVVLLVSETEDRFAPYLFDGAGAAPIELGRGEARADMHRYSLAPLPFGALHEFCEEGLTDIRDCERVKEGHGHLLMFYQVDHGGSLFAWDGKDYVEHSARKDLYKVGEARPSDEHPLAQHPWYVDHRPMQRDDRLPTFRAAGRDDG